MVRFLFLDLPSVLNSGICSKLWPESTILGSFLSEAQGSRAPGGLGEKGAQKKGVGGPENHNACSEGFEWPAFFVFGLLGPYCSTMKPKNIFFARGY